MKRLVSRLSCRSDDIREGNTPRAVSYLSLAPELICDPDFRLNTFYQTGQYLQNPLVAPRLQSCGKPAVVFIHLHTQGLDLFEFLRYLIGHGVTSKQDSPMSRMRG